LCTFHKLQRKQGDLHLDVASPMRRVTNESRPKSENAISKNVSEEWELEPSLTLFEVAQNRIEFPFAAQNTSTPRTARFAEQTATSIPNAS
jgi:uncharacterized caspase-like protein